MIRAVFQKDYFGYYVQIRLERSKTGHTKPVPRWLQQLRQDLIRGEPEGYQQKSVVAEGVWEAEMGVREEVQACGLSTRRKWGNAGP